MNKNFSVINTPASKVTITISRKQLWLNYVNCWCDVAWANNIDGTSFDSLKSIAKVLLVDGEMDCYALRKLFKAGDTVLLMGDAMEYIDVTSEEERRNRLLEIVVTDGDKLYVIRHEDISY